MRESSVLYVCLFALCIWHAKAVIYGTYTLLGSATLGLDSSSWQCASGAGLDCATYATPNNAQSISGISLSSTFVALPACAADQVLQFPTTSAILWPSIQATSYCYQLYFSGTVPTFSVYGSANPLPPLKFVTASAPIVVEQMTGAMTLSSLYADSYAGAVTIAAQSIAIQSLYMTRPATVTFKRYRNSTSTAGTNSVTLSGTTTIEFPIPTNGATVWNVNSAAGITIAGPFNLTSAYYTFELSVYNSSSTSSGAIITVTAPTLLISNGKLSLYSVTSGASSTISGTAVALNDQIATLKLAGSWSIASSASFSGNGTLDLSAALPTDGFILPSTHTGNTIKVAASSTLLATGTFNQVMLSSTGSFTVDRQNAPGVMDITTINAVTSVTLKNGKFRIVGTTVPVFLVSAELTITGSVGVQISGDTGSTIIMDSVDALKPPPVQTDGDYRIWNYAYTILGEFTAGKGLFLEKKCQVGIMGVSTLPDATTIDDATLTLERTFTFGVPIVVQNNGVLNLSPYNGAILDVRFANVTLLSGGQVINNAEFTPNGNGIFGVKGAKEGEFLSYAPIVVNNVTFTTDKLTLKENASLVIDASGVVSASTLYAAPSTWVDFAGTINLTDEFINDGEVYWGGKDTVGSSAITGIYAQNANGTTFLTITSLNDTQPTGEFDTLTVTGDVYLFGTLQLEFVDTASALALPDQAWYPIVAVTGASGGVFDKVQHNLGDGVTFKLCFTNTQGILVLSHNTTTSTATFANLPSGCDFVNAVPLSAPVDSITGPSASPSTVSSAVTFAVSYIVLLVSVLVLAVC